MATAGTVSVKIDGDSGTLIRELKKAVKVSKSSAAAIKKDLRTIGTVAKVAGAAAAAGLTLLVTNSLRANDVLGKTAQKLGTTTEALASMRFAAEQTGVSTTQLDLGLQRMTRRISEAGKGTGESVAALKELGLDAARLAQLPLDRQFAAIADAMENVTSQSDRIRLGFKLFDSEGVVLINTLKGGSSALDAYAQEAAALGVALNQFQVERIEQANEAFGRAKTAVEGLGNKITVALAPVLTVIADEFANFVKNFGTGGLSIAEMAGGIIKAILFIGDAIKGVQLVWQGLVVFAQATVAALVIIPTGLAAIIAEAVAGALKYIKIAIGATTDGIASAMQRVGQAVQGIEVLVQGAGLAIQTVFGAALAIPLKFVSVVADALGSTLELIANLARRVQTLPGFEGFADGFIGSITTAQAAVEVFAETSREKIAGIGEGLATQRSELIALAQGISEVAKPDLSGVTDGLVEGISQAESALGGFSINMQSVIANAEAGVDLQKAKFKEIGATIGENSGYAAEFVAKVNEAAGAAAAAAEAINAAQSNTTVTAGVDLEAAREAQTELAAFLIEKDRERAELQQEIEAELLRAQFENADVLALKKQELAAQLADFETQAELEKRSQLAAAKGEDATNLSELELLQLETQAKIKAAQDIANANKKAAEDVTKAWLPNLRKTESAHKQTWNSALDAFATFAEGSGKLREAVFKFNKAYGIGEAIVATWQGVAEALKLGWPQGIVAAAQVLATGLGAISSIKAAQPGGGGGGGSIATPSSTPTASEFSAVVADEAASADTAAARSGASVQIVIQGNLIAEDQYVREVLIPEIQSAVTDRDVVLIRGDSRNAAEIAERVA